MFCVIILTIDKFIFKRTKKKKKEKKEIMNENICMGNVSFPFRLSLIEFSSLVITIIQNKIIQ